MKIKVSVFLIVFVLVIVTLWNIAGGKQRANEEKEQLAVTGQMDLQTKSLTEVGPLKLNGTWEFYWGQFIYPEDRIASSPYFVSVPNTWNHYMIDDQTLPKHGFATYRLTIMLDKDDKGEVVSLYVPSIATAYQLWANGQLIAENGQVGKSRSQMIPKNYPQIATFIADEQQIELVLHVSNFDYHKAGMWEPMIFGTVEQIIETRENNLLLQMFVIGCIFIISFYHLLLFFQRPKELSPLFLALACFFVVLRTLLLKDTLLVYLFPKISWEIAVHLQHLAGIMALLFFLLFTRRELSFDMPKMITKCFSTILILYSMFVAVTPVRILSHAFLFFKIMAFLIMLCIVIVSFVRMVRKREGATLNVMAMLILFTALLNDIFYYSHWITTNEFVSFGILFYLFIQSIHLSRRFSLSFEKVESLSEKYQRLNHSLEEKVEKRTEELRDANDKMQKIEKARRRLLASVSHELNTPLTFIQGYIKAMIDGVISKDDSTYLRTIYSDTKMMAHIIRDLQELSKLEAGQVRFQFKEVEMASFFCQLYEEHQSVVEEKGFQFYLKEYLPDEEIICLIDPVRIKQVYMNVMTNARKFTPVGGTITLEMDLLSRVNEEMIKISVHDTGAGIAQEDLPFVFDRFYKSKQRDEGEQRGAGLGLAIAKEIIEQHHGSMWVESQQGKGSTFSFSLPVQQRGGDRDDQG
ncbi:ATP-binding protein [Bacillus sp. FJAT-50079]|uniref:ATP-binding protein n=1 Tax=Bacillus sp. FJAT-50079 TaxID=2833577 RepID=UPI001BCA5E87|nr:ATP-binding protein [Bacillus sp. FJAT-50079]MBS4208329.1 hypothetical protein [Bacillus sp. FJAT-50079]